MLASTTDERAQLASLYDAELDRIEVVPPGVDHTSSLPAIATPARHRLGISAPRVMLFVGRIQPLKGADLAIRALAALDDPKSRSSSSAARAAPTAPPNRPGCTTLAAELGVSRQIHWVSPRRHERLADYYRAADVCIVPSRSESFGLVALEAAACGTPVVAAAVGGLRSLVR